MAYEKDVVSLLNYLGVEQRNNAYYEMADEVKDVYAKAKAYDEILNIDLDQHEIIVHGQVEDILKKYMEDE